LKENNNKKLAISKAETRSQGMARMQDFASFTPEPQEACSGPKSTTAGFK